MKKKQKAEQHKPTTDNDDYNFANFDVSLAKIKTPNPILKLNDFLSVWGPENYRDATDYYAY
jgi:hypothetical protein